jgi:alkaline phosphatase D
MAKRDEDVKEGDRDEPEESDGAGAGLGRRDFLATTIAATAAVVAGCSGDDAPATPDAAGEGDGGRGDAGRDAGQDGGRDAGRPADGGRIGDGGMPDDGSVAMDAGEDAGADAGPEEDAGPGIEGPEAIPESAAFPLGVSSGDVTDTTAILWTQYTGTSALQLAVYEMRGDVYIREVAAIAVTPAAGGFVHHDFGDLTAARHYRYAFFELTGTMRTGRTRIGRFRAASAPDAMERLLFGAVSCVSNMRAITPIERAGARTDLATFLLLGDTTYNDGAVTVDQYRAEWASNFDRTGYLDLRANTSVLATWDDHEVDNDWNPERTPAAQVTAATQVFFENLPLRRDPAARDRIWKTKRWGLTVEIFVLDCRGERSPARDEYVSRAQMDWLKAGLLASPCVFKLIMNSVPITDFPGFFDFASRDRWEGYAAQRTEILDHIDDMAIEGVFWVAGDFHLASAQTVGRAGASGATQFEVLVGPGAQTPNALAGTLGAPQFRWAAGTNNYSTLDLDPMTRTITVRWIAGDGTEAHRESFTL